MSLNFIKRLVGQGREKTREEIIAHIVRRAHDQYHHATNEMDLDTRVAMRNYRVDIALPEGKFGPEAAALHQDLRDGRADDLYAALRESKLIFAESVLPGKGEDGGIQIRVVYDTRPQALREKMDGPSITD